MSTPHADRRSNHRQHSSIAAPVDSATALVGLLLALGAAVPLVGWGAGWVTLASVLPGWPVVAPGAALALLALGIALVGQRPGVPVMLRRALAATGGWSALLLALVLRSRASGRPLVSNPSALVEGWVDLPGAALQYWPSRAAAVAIALLAMAVALLAIERAGTLRAAWMAAAGAALLALAGGGIPAPPTLAENTVHAARAALDARAAVITPPLAWLIILGACGVLLREGDHVRGWVSARGGGMAAARRLLPAVLLLPPALVWLTELAEHSRWLQSASAHALLVLGLVTGFGAVAALAVHRLGQIATEERERVEKRRHRARERDVEEVARGAEESLRHAADRYRTQLRAILEVAPTPFVALDRDGSVTYANAAVLSALRRQPGDVFGRPLQTVWPSVARAIDSAAAGAVLGAPLIRHITTAEGEELELRGFPSEDGMALFIRTVRARD